jgi:hypothetical protein
MVQNNNQETTKGIIQAGNLQISRDKIPNEFSDKIVYTCETNPIVLKRSVKAIAGSLSDATSSNFFTTSTTKRTFLLGAHLAYSKDALAQSILSQMSVTPLNSSAVGLLLLRYEPLTAGSGSTSINLKYPMELQPGSNLTLINSNATASIDLTGIVYYYEEDKFI